MAVSAGQSLSLMRLPQRNRAAARPFLKWVGGKTQLLRDLESHFPPQLKKGEIKHYVEPFVGGGSMFFHVAQNYSLDSFLLADNNPDLILAYWTVREYVGALITTLHDFQLVYSRMTESKREAFYYKIRDRFNSNSDLDLTEFSPTWVKRTAQLLFLNKTCFNGLYRVNSNGQFNVAFGQYKEPRICDADNLVAASRLLQKADVVLCDFDELSKFIKAKSFIYLDPPYRPLNETSSFTGYSPNNFNSDDQKRLAQFCRTLSSRGAKVLISNSDPSNEDPTDDYFEKMYPSFRIEKTLANRMINCKADKRGKINELMLMNY